MCLYSALQLDAGVLHDHLINHTNKNNLLVLYLKEKNHTSIFRCETEKYLRLWLISDVRSTDVHRQGRQRPFG